jgi:hypothetical protein
VFHPRDIGTVCHQQSVSFEHVALVREVDGGKFDALSTDVLPHIDLCPVRDGETTDMFTTEVTCVVKIP